MKRLQVKTFYINDMSQLKIESNVKHSEYFSLFIRIAVLSFVSSLVDKISVPLRLHSAKTVGVHMALMITVVPYICDSYWTRPQLF